MSGGRYAPPVAPARAETEASSVGSSPTGSEHAEWVAAAGRFAPLLDGVEYFAALRRALIGAQRQVLVLGWEFHSEIDLLRGDEGDAPGDGWPVRLADLLLALVEAREDLRIELVIWKGASLFAFERQHLPRMKRPWAAHDRLRLTWDDDVPRLGSKHQKVVVIDDRVAFAGGMDLTQARWDTHEHRPGDRRRRKPGLIPAHYAPYHDAMSVMDGEAAARLGDWCRERLRRVRGEALAPPADPGGEDPWPDAVAPLLRDVAVACALTEPDHGGREEKRQVERSFVQQIEAAERLVLVESQYLTAEPIAAALERRLADPDGPEVVAVLPYGCPGNVQSLAMDPRRDAVLDRLRGAAGEGRFLAGWPTLAGGDEESVFERSTYVHAKVMIVDDRLVRIGSSNLNHRSMGLDAELDVFVEGGDADRGAVADFRRRVLSYHLGVAPEALARAEEDLGSVVAAIESMRGGERSLHPFEHRAEGPLHDVGLPLELADPDRPLEDAEAEIVLRHLRSHTTLLDRFHALRNMAIGVLRRSKRAIAAAAVLLALALVWRVSPFGSGEDAGAFARRWIDATGSSPLGVLGVTLAFILVASLGFPVTVLIAALAATFGPWRSLAIAGFGVAVSSMIGFHLGRRLRDRRAGAAAEGLDRDVGAGRVTRLVQRMEGRGLLAVAVLRNLPVAPFALVNMGCGATRLDPGRFLAGTLLGMAPGIAVLCALGGEVGDLLESPDLMGLARVAIGLVAALAAFLGLRSGLRRLADRRTRRGD